MADEKIIIKYGYRWIRFLIIPLFVGSIVGIFYGDNNIWNQFLYIIIYGLLYYLFYKWRRLKHDSSNFYIIHGKNERIVPFENIISIKRSKSKLNSERFWIVKYTDENGKDRKCRYFSSFFNKDFHNAVREVNPKVIIWTHPYFNH